MFLILLIFTDVSFIVLHSINGRTPFVDNSLFSLVKDRSFPEMYQYLKWFWIVNLLVYASRSRRSLGYIAWGLLFTYFFFDDALSIHERVGSYIAGNINLTLPLGLGLQDFGELAVSVVAGMILFPIILFACWYGSQTFKKISYVMILLILALVFFGVIVDTARNSIQLGGEVYFFLGIVEDGGEMLVASLILWYVFLLSICGETIESEEKFAILESIDGLKISSINNSPVVLRSYSGRFGEVESPR